MEGLESIIQQGKDQGKISVTVNIEVLETVLKTIKDREEAIANLQKEYTDYRYKVEEKND